MKVWMRIVPDYPSVAIADGPPTIIDGKESNDGRIAIGIERKDNPELYNFIVNTWGIVPHKTKEVEI